MRTLARFGAVALAGLTLVACGDDDATADAPEDVTAWCALIRDVDTQFDETDNSSDDLEVKQEHYEAIADDLERLQAGIGLVDSAYREDVGEALDLTLMITDAFTGAEDYDDVEAAMAPIWEDAEYESTISAAAPWIEKTCRVSID